MKKCFVFVLFISLFLLGGCRKKEPGAMSHVVTAVDISSQQEDVQIRRHYTSQEKMEYVLLYLRLLKRTGAPQTDPETAQGDIYKITVSLADGRQQVYRQKDHRYLSVNDRPWQIIDPGQAAGLYRLLREVPGDAM